MQKKGGAPRKAPDGLTVSLYFRTDAAFVERVDAAKDRRNAEGGPEWSRADVIRRLLTGALDRDEAAAAGPKDAPHTVDRVADAGARRKGAKS